jgi:hypothetical protein
LKKELEDKEKELVKEKSSIEESKIRIQREYELVSSSLHELAIQFMSMKNEQKKSLNSYNSKSWLECERSKLFPSDK